MNDENQQPQAEIDGWPVPSAEVRLELDRRAPAWAEPEDERR